jgi:hypothetical protein
MNRCPNCAAQNREGAKFCTSCGFRLPVESAPLVTNDRSPFATTATPSGSAATASPPVSNEFSNGDDSDDQGFATWGADSMDQPAPGKSWDASPPTNTAVPVSDEMIASLVGDIDSPLAEDENTVAESRPVPARPGGNASVDELLRLARELEYGLIELAEAPAALASTAGNVERLRNTLADLHDEDELEPLRNAVNTAQERPRDVDVMLDLVLRADSIGSLLVERDQLKSAIEMFLNTSHGSDDAAESAEDSIDAEDASGAEAETFATGDDMVSGDDQPSI